MKSYSDNVPTTDALKSAVAETEETAQKRHDAVMREFALQRISSLVIIALLVAVLII